MCILIKQNYKRIFLFIMVHYSLIYGMQSEAEIAATIRSAIAKKVTAGLRHHAHYQIILDTHLENLKKCPLYQRAHFYMITYMDQEWSMYVPSKKL